MAIRVVSNGNGETHVAATYYVIDPLGILHLYSGDVNVASYRDWSSVYVALQDGTPPAETPAAVVPTPPTPHGPRVVVQADDGSVAALNVDSVTLSGTPAKRVRVGTKGLTVPRGGFGSSSASA